MKKYLLTALLGVFAFVGFTNATSYSFTAIKDYSPDTITFESDFSVPSDLSDFISSYSCNYCLGEEECGINCRFEIYSDDEVYYFECPGTTDGTIDFDDCYSDFPSVIPAGTYTVDRGSESAFNSLTITDGQNSGGDSGDSSGSLLPGGESDLSGILSGLNSVINEFLPYLVYIGLGLITATIGFVAIRWLVNRTSSKVRGTFSSGRRRK